MNVFCLIKIQHEKILLETIKNTHILLYLSIVLFQLTK